MAHLGHSEAGMATLRKRGDRWQVQVRRKGQAQKTASFALRKDALEWGRQTELQADRRELPPDAKCLESITLRQLVERYRDEITKKKRGGETETIVLNAFLRNKICTKVISDISSKDFAVYRDERLKTVTPSTVKRQLAPIQNLFEIAKKEWHLPIRTNPLSDMRLPEADNRRERRLRPGELDRLLEAASELQTGILARIIVFAVETGMRRGEILSMRFRDIDPQDRSVHIPKTKTGHARTIPLSPRALAVITPSNRPLVFPTSANALRLAWERLTEAAKIEDLHFHDLRHEGISRWFEKGLSLPEVQLLSGHRTLAMLSRYTHAQRKIIQDKLST